MTVTVKPPQTTEEFAQYYDLRWRVLLAPWQQPHGAEKDDRESVADHVMACDDNGNVVGAARLHFNTPTEAQVRYMAVEPLYRGTGVGRAMLNYLERAAKAGGAKEIVLNAREESVGFYRKMGYERLSDGPTVFGCIRHTLMCKHIPACPT
jgi:N-acetylglutamate synthase-like GNAT family acetyltransferase